MFKLVILNWLMILYTIKYKLEISGELGKQPNIHSLLMRNIWGIIVYIFTHTNIKFRLLRLHVIIEYLNT